MWSEGKDPYISLIAVTGNDPRDDAGGTLSMIISSGKKRHQSTTLVENVSRPDTVIHLFLISIMYKLNLQTKTVNRNIKIVFKYVFQSNIKIS